MDFLKAIAPWLATALAGPAGGMAVDAIGKALGIDEPTMEKVKEVVGKPLSAEDQLKLKMAEQQFAKDMEQMRLDAVGKATDAEVRDRDSARNREIQTKDTTNTVLAYTIVGGFISMMASVLLGYSKVDSAMTGMLVGYASAKCEQVIAYYFGNTKSSNDKTKWIVNGK